MKTERPMIIKKNIVLFFSNIHTTQFQCSGSCAKGKKIEQVLDFWGNQTVQSCLISVATKLK